MSGDKGVGTVADPVADWVAVAAAIPWVAALIAVVTIAAISTRRVNGGIPEPAGLSLLPPPPAPLPPPPRPPKSGLGVPTSGLVGVEPAP